MPGAAQPASPPPGVVARLRSAGCVFAEDEARLLVAAAAIPADVDALVQRRVRGEPLEHILGWAEFCGLRISVDPGVFVPRRRSEFLVQRAARLAAGRPVRPARAVVVDLCCGSGAVGAALAAELGWRGRPVDLHATDLDPAAVRCARRNLVALGGRVYQGDLDAPLPAVLRNRVELLVANAPYVPTPALGLMPPEARLHEPRAALDGGGDGLDVLRRVVAVAPCWLAPGGHLLMETSRDQAPVLVAAVTARGLVPRVACSAEQGATVVMGTRWSTGRRPARAR